MIIRAEPLTREAFAVFGDVLETGGREATLINHGLTRKFATLSLVQVDPGAVAQLCIYRSDPVGLPFHLREFERHPLAGQVFMPLHTRPFPVVVAAGQDVPDPENIRAFITDGRQGVSLRPGVWHHHQLSLVQKSDYLVIERDSEDGNLETCRLEDEVVLQL